MAEAIQWGPGREKLFTEWACREVQRALQNRTSMENKWRDWLDQYRAPTTTELKRFPFEGASNRTLPLTGMNVDPLIARFLTTIHAPSNIWSVQPLNERWVDVSKPLQDYLEWWDQMHLHMFDVNYRALLEFVKLGTCIYKVGWLFERRKSKSYDANGRLVDDIKILSRPFVDHVSLVDFVLPPEALHIQADEQGGASWVAERIWLRKDQFLARAKGQEPFAPDYKPEAVDLVKRFEEQRFGNTGGGSGSSGGTVEAKRYELDRNVPSQLLRIELFEVHARFGIMDDSDVNDVTAIVHVPSNTLLRSTANPYRHGMRPYEVARYFRGDGFYGIGVCEQSEMFQSLGSDLLNYQVDNVLISNAPMLAIKMGANVVPGEPIYPLKTFALDNPDTDMRVFKFGEVYPSLPQLSGIIQSWHEKRTGINDTNSFGNMSGMPSRTPATSLLSILQEGARRFDLSLKELRVNCLDRIGLRLLQLLQQYLSNPAENPEAMNTLQMSVMALGEPEGTYVAQKLALPMEEIENGVGVSITATSGSSNKEVEKQSFLALVQLQAQLAPQYLQMAEIFTNPQVQQMAPQVATVAGELFRGFANLQKRLLEQYDVRNPEDILVDAAALAQTTEAIGQPQLGPGAPAGANGGPVGSATDLAGVGGMAQLLGLAGAAV